MDTQISLEEIIKLLENGFKPETIAFEFDLSEEYVNSCQKLLQGKEGSLEDLKTRVKMLKREQNWAEVERLEQLHLQLEPENLKVIRNLTKALKLQGKWAELEDFQKGRLAVEPDNLTAMSRLAVALKSQGKWEELESLIKRRLELKSEDLKALSDVALALKMQRKWSELESLQKRRLEIEPENLKALSDLALALKMQRKWIELESLQKRRLEIEPEDLKAMADVALAFKTQGKWEELEALLKRRLEIEPDNLKTKKYLKMAIKKASKKKARKNFDVGEDEKNIPRSDKNEIKHKLLSNCQPVIDDIAKYRQEIKAGTLNIERTNQIIEELKQTGGVKANILIAEIQARVMGQPLLSTRFLQNCKKSATTEAEKKAYSRAIEIVKQKKTVVFSKLEDIEER